MASSADPVGRASTSAAARCWNAAGYSITGGQAAWSETALAQPVKKIVTVPRAITPGFQHPAVRIIGFFHGLKALGRASGLFAGAARAKDEEKDGDGQREPRECPPPQRGKEGDHRRPRFQSSSRA